jgi:phospholipase D1/2
MGDKSEQSRSFKGELQANVLDGHKSDSAEQKTDAKRRFEATQQHQEETKSAYSVAHHAMAGQGPLSEEPWDGEPDDEIDNWIQEELYIHAKLLIADDRVVICGSSNINDRSQLGYHDSELSIVMEDTNRFQSTMDGQPFEAGWHAATLRRYLWREHLGLLPPQEMDASNDPNAQPPGDDSPNDPWDRDDSWKLAEDPLGDKLWEVWTEQATQNTLVYRQLFHADPDDHGKHCPRCDC